CGDNRLEGGASARSGDRRRCGAACTAAMLVQIKKGRDRRPTLVCIRADGTRTWSQVHPFFPLHDLTHFAVESVLGFREAFFGLVESGWSIETFAEPQARKRMPAQALWAENIVGLLDLERGMQRRLPAAELNRALTDSLTQQHVPPFRPLRENELASVRALRAELDARWSALAPGETIEVSFP
ncbi:MAG: hypothetical protein ACREMR_04400, partial [Gemmatimonadales bacterium]